MYYMLHTSFTIPLLFEVIPQPVTVRRFPGLVNNQLINPRSSEFQGRQTGNAI